MSLFSGSAASTAAPAPPKAAASAVQLPKKFQAHRSAVCSLAWNADGRHLASGSKDTTLRIWQPEKDAKNSSEMRGHTEEVSCTKWDPSHPEHLATCSENRKDSNLHFWDIRQGKPTATVPTRGGTLTMTYSPDGKTLILANRSDFVTIIDVVTRKVVSETRQARETNKHAFSHDGKLLFRTLGGSLRIESCPEEKELYNIQASSVSIVDVDLDPRGRYVALGGNDTNLSLWETEYWTCEKAFSGEGAVRGIGFSPDGSMIASRSEDSSVILRSVPSGSNVVTLNTGSACADFAWHPFKNLLAYATEDEGRAVAGSGAFRVWGL